MMAAHQDISGTESEATVAQHDQRAAIARKIGTLGEADLRSLNAMDALDALSSKTEVDFVDTDPGSIIVHSDGSFEAAGTVYVMLNYGGSRDASSMSDGYPMTLRGRSTADGTVDVELAEADTRSFYG